MFDNKIYVYDEKMRRIATFDSNTEGLSEEGMRNLMVSPTVHLEQNGVSSFSFQMLADCEKWQEIKDPRNIYEVNGRLYTAMNDGAFAQVDDNGVPVINASLLETWSLLSRKYTQVYNCGIYTYAKAKFVGYEGDGAKFTISASDCLNPGETITSAKAWEQVKAWTPKDEKGNQLTYAILTSDKYKATNWEDVPTGVFLKSFSVSGNTATLVMRSRAKNKIGQVFQYNSSGSYRIDVKPLPTSVESVIVNYTTVDGQKGDPKITYTTSEKTVTNYSYNSSTGVLSLRYYPSSNETVNGITVVYFENDLGKISPGATCTLAYGAEAIDEHTFVVLPKANKKYKLTIDGVSYNDSEVKDARGEVMPRGSGGYAMWAALKNSGWKLGVCDVLATDFDASIDYGCFNIEADMKDVLYIVEYIQQLYGGILIWDSMYKILHYRAENSTDYQAHKDSFNKWNGYVFREGKNLTERPEIAYDNSIITRAYLLGYGNLNVKAVNDGKSYIENFSYTDEVYSGYLEQPLIYDTRDEGGQRQLLYWGQRELKKRCRPRKNVSLSAQDLRTVEGLEHEVFDINDIVRVYYHNGVTGEDEYEDMRVTMWEYNVFAMWDSTIELGDRVQNLTELFKLIYKGTLQPPGSNASGEISSNRVHISQIGFGGDGDGWFGYGDSDSLTRHIELIAQTTTETSNAIAGLILDTDAMHSQVDLFALYQKQTDKLFTESYAGLTFYADEKSAHVLNEAKVFTREEIKTAKGQLETKISKIEGKLDLEIENGSAKLSAFLDGTWQRYVDGSLQWQVKSIAGFQSYIDQTKATADAFAYFSENENSPFGLVKKEASAAMSLSSTNEGALATLSANYKNFTENIDGTIRGVMTDARVVTEANAEHALSGLFATMKSNGDLVTSATVMTYVTESEAWAQMKAAVGNMSGVVDVRDGVVYIRAERAFNSYVMVDSSFITLESRVINLDANSINLNGHTLHFSKLWLTDGEGNKNNFYIVAFDRISD